MSKFLLLIGFFLAFHSAYAVSKSKISILKNSQKFDLWRTQ